MKRLSVLALLLAGATQDPPAMGWSAAGTQGAVAAGGSAAVAAGIEILKGGGNAIDAAVATLLALSVTDSTLFCFGSEVPILVYDANRGTVEVVVGLGAAPKLATREHFEAGGIPARGVEPAAVPAALDACVTALGRYGTRSFEEAAAPMLALLDANPAEWRGDLATTIRRLVESERQAQGDRGRKLRAVSDFFYRGPLAREMDAWLRENGGLLRYEDLAAHTTPVEPPAAIEYQGHTVCKGGAWTQGPWLLQALRLLEGFDLRNMGHNSADSIHVAVEAMKLALADRDWHYADPRVVEVPLEKLLSKEYAILRRPLIDLGKASLTQRPGDPRLGKAILENVDLRRGPGGEDRDTTTCVVADRWGNVVAATPSGFSGVTVGETGVTLGTRLQSFNTWKDHPNCIAPGKRPRITLTPTIVLKGGRPVMAVSVAGGDQQDQVTLQLLLNQIDFGLPPDRSVTMPRFDTKHFLGSFRQAPPRLGAISLNTALGEEKIEALKARGHHVTATRGTIAAPVVLVIDPATGALHAAGDPRARRHAAAY